MAGVTSSGSCWLTPGKCSSHRRIARSAGTRVPGWHLSRAYRVVEAMRNLVQHREMPLLYLTRTKERDGATGQPVTKVYYSFPVSDLLNSPKYLATVKNEFRNTPEMELEFPVIVDEAMAAITRHSPVPLDRRRGSPRKISAQGVARSAIEDASAASAP